jgi:hypothetical protein
MTGNNESQKSGQSLFDEFRSKSIEENSSFVNDVDDELENSTLDSTQTGTDQRLNGRGHLKEEVRPALITLLKQGVILHSRKPKVFELILSNKDAVVDHLADMNLVLTLDERGGMAFIRQVGEEDFDEDEDDSIEMSATMISRRALTLYETYVVLILRRHFQEREASGETKIIIDVEKILNDIVPFMPLSNSSNNDRKRLNGTLKALQKKNLIMSVRNNEDRFEISPIIRHVVNAEFLENMISEYQKLAHSGVTDSPGEIDEQ